MNPQFEEHLRDSVPDNSRFDGFDRGDDAREVDPGYSDLGHDPVASKPAKRGPSTATHLLAALGLLSSRPVQQIPAGVLPRFLGQHTASKGRRSARRLCKQIGRRQYRRATCVGYALDARNPILL